MKKLIKTKEGTMLWSLEETIENFKGMLNKAASTMERDLAKFQGNVDTFEDCFQKCVMVLMKNYEEYDIQENLSFSTILFRNLNEALIQEVRRLSAKKRKITRPLVYIHKEVEKGLEISNIISNKENDTYFLNKDCELEIFLKKHLTEKELIFLSLGMKKNIRKVKETDRFLGLFEGIEKKYGINIDSKRMEVAAFLGISRPTLNKHIKQVMDKAQSLLTNYLELERTYK